MDTAVNESQNVCVYDLIIPAEALHAFMPMEPTTNLYIVADTARLSSSPCVPCSAAAANHVNSLIATTGRHHLATTSPHCGIHVED